MIQLNLDEEQTLLVEYACSLFLESLIGSKGALEALQKQGAPNEVVKKQIEEELKEAEISENKIRGVLEQFEKPINKKIDFTTKPDFLK